MTESTPTDMVEMVKALAALPEVRRCTMEYDTTVSEWFIRVDGQERRQWRWWRGIDHVDAWDFFTQRAPL